MSNVRSEIEQVQNEIKWAASLANMVVEILEVGSSQADVYAGAVQLLKNALDSQAQQLDQILDRLFKESKEVKAA